MRIVVSAALAISAMLATPTDADAAKRVALMVGNNAYLNAPALATAASDARAFGEKLRQLGFEANVATDATKQGMDAALADFLAKAQGADISLFYFAGHSIAAASDNFMVGVDAPGDPSEIAPFTIPLSAVVARMGEVAKVTLVFHDSNRASVQGFAPPAGHSPAVPAEETLIAFATAPGGVALDGEKISPFASALLQYLGSGADILEEMSKVRAEVAKRTQGQQLPWQNSSLVGIVDLSKPD